MNPACSKWSIRIIKKKKNLISQTANKCPIFSIKKKHTFIQCKLKYSRQKGRWKLHKNDNKNYSKLNQTRGKNCLIHKHAFHNSWTKSNLRLDNTGWGMETYELVPYLYLGMKDRDIAIQPSAWQVFMIDFICSFSCRVLSLFWAEYSAVPFVIKFYKIEFSNAIFICTFSYFNVDHPCGWLTRTCMHKLEQGVNTLAIDSQLGGSTGRPEGKIKREKDSCHSVICNIMVESSYHMRPYQGDEHINMWQMSICLCS